MATPKGWRKLSENKVSILKTNSQGDKYGEVFAWKEEDGPMYVTVHRDAEGSYDIMKGTTRDSRRQNPVDFAQTKNEARKKAVSYMEKN